MAFPIIGQSRTQTDLLSAAAALVPAAPSSLAQTCFSATSVVQYWGAAPNPAATACYLHMLPTRPPLAAAAARSSCFAELAFNRCPPLYFRGR